MCKPAVHGKNPAPVDRWFISFILQGWFHAYKVQEFYAIEGIRCPASILPNISYFNIGISPRQVQLHYLMFLFLAFWQERPKCGRLHSEYQGGDRAGGFGSLLGTYLVMEKDWKKATDLKNQGVPGSGVIVSMFFCAAGTFAIRMGMNWDWIRKEWVFFIRKSLEWSWWLSRPSTCP